MRNEEVLLRVKECGMPSILLKVFMVSSVLTGI